MSVAKIHLLASEDAPLITPTISKPTFHNLNHSQSQRILWLLEELNIDYTLINHFRQKDHLSPDSLKAVSSTGSAPAFTTADGTSLVESLAIATYLLRTYDTTHKFGGGPALDDANVDWLRDEEITSFASTTFGFLVQFLFIMEMMVNMVPFFLKPMFWFVKFALGSAFRPRLKICLKWLDEKLSDRRFFGGEELGRADFILSYPMDQCFDRGMLKLEEWPRLKAWQERCREREGWKRALSKGNGYKWTRE